MSEPVAYSLDGGAELGLRDPLREEVGRHVRVGHVLEGDLAGAHAVDERVVATEEVLRARGARGGGADGAVGEVVRGVMLPLTKAEIGRRGGP